MRKVRQSEKRRRRRSSTDRSSDMKGLTLQLIVWRPRAISPRSSKTLATTGKLISILTWSYKSHVRGLKIHIVYFRCTFYFQVPISEIRGQWDLMMIFWSKSFIPKMSPFKNNIQLLPWGLQNIFTVILKVDSLHISVVRNFVVDVELDIGCREWVATGAVYDDPVPGTDGVPLLCPRPQLGPDVDPVQARGLSWWLHHARQNM